jgi:hypothetical protein
MMANEVVFDPAERTTDWQVGYTFLVIGLLVVRVLLDALVSRWRQFVITFPEKHCVSGVDDRFTA